MVNYSPLTYSTNWVAHPNSRSGFQPRKTLNTEKTNKSSSLLNSINSNFHNFSHPFPSVTTLTSLGFPQVFSMFSPCFPDVFPALN